MTGLLQKICSLFCSCCWKEANEFDEPLLEAKVAISERDLEGITRLQTISSHTDIADVFNVQKLKDLERPKTLTFSDFYVLKDKIGKGSTSVVYSCQSLDCATSEKLYAVKIINKQKVKAVYPLLLRQLKQEIRILEVLEHPNIIALHGMYESQRTLHLVTEYAGGGELFDYLVSRPKGLLSEAEAAFMIRQILSAVVYMHQKNVMHRDLKLENVLLSDRPSNNRVKLKLIDFGLAKSTEESSTAKTFFGTVGYIAPEMLSRNYTNKIDIWAVGVLVYILLCGVFPFEDDIRKQRDIDYTVKFPPWAKAKLSESSKELLEQLLQVNPEKRITAKEAILHPWIQGCTASPQQILSSPRQLALLGNKNGLLLENISLDKFDLDEAL